VHVKNLLRALYKNYLLFTIHFKVCIIELFWLVNFGTIIQSQRSLYILSEMIWFIDRPILLAPYFLIVQSEELLLLKPVIFTKNSMVHDHVWRKCSSFSLYKYPQMKSLIVHCTPQKCGCTLKNEGKKVHVPPGEKNLWGCWLLLLYKCSSTITALESILIQWNLHLWPHLLGNNFYYVTFILIFLHRVIHID
jgi:hypothetical protein